MNRAVAFSGPGTGGKPAGPVPLMSPRDTIAAYFDANGIVQEAQPYELRPNYVYQGGVWVQNGWLKEAATTNVDSAFNQPYNSGFHINNETCVDYTDTAGRNGFKCTLKASVEQSNPIQYSGSYGQYVNSVYVWCEDFTKLRVAPRASADEFPYIQIDPHNRRYYTHGYFQPYYVNTSSSPLDIRVCGPMAEVPNSTGTPTSWVPYQQTRASDL